MKQNSFLSGTFILIVGGFLAKVFSAVYRILLTRILGGEGIGLYQLVFPFYSLCVVLATAGLPMAISKVIAKNPSCAKAVVKRIIKIFLYVSAGIALILILSSKFLAIVQGQKNIWICYVILSPTIILASVCSVLRGYFQGLKYFTPSAVSNIIEQFVKLILGLGVSLFCIRYGVFYAVVGALFCVDISEIASLLILLIYVRKHNTDNQTNLNFTTKEIIKDILPITVTNVILPLAGFVDSLLVVNLLKLNFSNNVAIFMYGIESGAVASIVGVPTIFSFAIATVVLPNLTSNVQQKNRNRKLAMALRCVMIIVVPAVVLFVFTPKQIIDVLYANRIDAYGIDGANIASRLLAVSGIGVIFLSLNQVYSVSLQSVEKRFVTIKNLLISVVIKFLIELIFMPSVSVNIYALALSNVVCYLIAFALNYVEMKQSFNLKFDFIFAGKLIISNTAMLLTLITLLSLCQTKMTTLFAFMASALVYLIFIVLLKVLSKKDIATSKYITN